MFHFISGSRDWVYMDLPGVQADYYVTEHDGMEVRYMPYNGEMIVYHESGTRLVLKVPFHAGILGFQQVEELLQGISWEDVPVDEPEPEPAPAPEPEPSPESVVAEAMDAVNQATGTSSGMPVEDR